MDGEDSVEEEPEPEQEEGRLTEELSSSDDGMVVIPAEEGEEREDRPPRGDREESTHVFRDDRLRTPRPEERLSAPDGERGGNRLREQV